MLRTIHDVVGIGVDTGSALIQLKSRNINTDSLVTISSTTNITDGQFLLWGNDNGPLTGTTQVPNPYYRRLNRAWLVAETSEVGTVTLSFDLSTIDDDVNFDNNLGFALLIDADGDFSDATTITNLSINGNVVTFSSIDLVDGEYFSLAYPKVGDVTLAFSKTAEDVDESPLEPGDEILYILIVTNLLNINHAGVVITDAIPANATYVAGSAQVSQSTVNDLDPLVADTGTLTVGGNATFIFCVTVDVGADGQTIENTAQADSSNQYPTIEVGPIASPEGGTIYLPDDTYLSL